MCPLKRKEAHFWFVMFAVLIDIYFPLHDDTYITLMSGTRSLWAMVCAWPNTQKPITRLALISFKNRWNHCAITELPHGLFSRLVYTITIRLTSTNFLPVSCYSPGQRHKNILIIFWSTRSELCNPYFWDPIFLLHWAVLGLMIIIIPSSLLLL